MVIILCVCVVPLFSMVAAVCVCVYVCVCVCVSLSLSVFFLFCFSFFLLLFVLIGSTLLCEVQKHAVVISQTVFLFYFFSAATASCLAWVSCCVCRTEATSCRQLPLPLTAHSVMARPLLCWDYREQRGR